MGMPHMAHGRRMALRRALSLRLRLPLRAYLLLLAMGYLSPSMGLRSLRKHQGTPSYAPLPRVPIYRRSAAMRPTPRARSIAALIAVV